eukprot:6343109-Pyramimonas_sp.AAC.1
MPGMGLRPVLVDLGDVVLDEVLVMHVMGHWSWRAGGCPVDPRVTFPAAVSGKRCMEAMMLKTNVETI